MLSSSTFVLPFAPLDASVIPKKSGSKASSPPVLEAIRASTCGKDPIVSKVCL